MYADGVFMIHEPGGQPNLSTILQSTAESMCLLCPLRRIIIGPSDPAALPTRSIVIENRLSSRILDYVFSFFTTNDPNISTIVLYTCFI